MFIEVLQSDHSTKSSSRCLAYFSLFIYHKKIIEIQASQAPDFLEKIMIKKWGFDKMMRVKNSEITQNRGNRICLFLRVAQ